jgi:oligosaccharide repeat unit polymerase|tara:strand:+ start:2279 stop:3574 length:1296 start_codon:yes stop_codon:yes gene_type:complete
MLNSRFFFATNRIISFFLNSILQCKTKKYTYHALTFLSEAFFLSTTFKFLRVFLPFYPVRLWGLFDQINLRFKSTFDIFHPMFIFPLIFACFISISSYRISYLALATILIGISFFCIGVQASKAFKFNEIFLEEKLEKFIALLLLLGIISLIYDVMQTGGIPLLDPAAKRNLNVPLTMLASVTVVGGILLISLIGKRYQSKSLEIGEARIFSIITIVIITLLMSLIGYRTQIIVSILGSIIAMYYSRILGKAEILISFLFVFFTISALGYYRALVQGSSIAFFDVIGKRVGLTLSIYDFLVDRFWIFGVNKLSVLLASFSSFISFVPGPRLGPRTIVAKIYGVTDVSITSTLYGTVILDLGLPGIILFSLILGFVLGLAYVAMKRTKTAVSIGIFSLFLAYTLVGIETGLVDFNVLMFFMIGSLILIRSIR